MNLRDRLERQRHRYWRSRKGTLKRRKAKAAIAWLKAAITRKQAKLGERNHLVERYIAEVNRCIGLGLHYVWGGGHGHTPAPANGPFDCSSFASHLDQTVVQGVATGTTFTMAEPGPGLDSGAGRYITHFIKNEPASDAHVITRIVYRGRTYWTQCGGRDNTRPGDGPCWFNPTASRIREFPIKVHPRGL